MVSNVKQISELLGRELLLDFDRSVWVHFLAFSFVLLVCQSIEAVCVRSDAVTKAFAMYGINIRQEIIVAVLAEVTDHVTRQILVDDLLMQVLQMFKQTRKAVDELLTARFRKFDEVRWDFSVACSNTKTLAAVKLVLRTLSVFRFSRA
eukprot:COSAG02_NODE_15051_length_1209_cov_12.881498_2_plen_149_part_00